MRALQAIMMALFLGAGLPHAADYKAVCAPDQLGSHGGNEFVGVAFLLVSLAIAGAYMYGHAMQSERADVWAKDEAANLLISVLLFAGLVAVFTGACTLASEYADANPFVASYRYLDRLVYNTGLESARFLVLESLRNQKDATRYLYIGFVPYTGHGIGADANYRALSANKEFMVDLLLPMAASLSAQRQILQIIEIFASSMLLPFAFILRVIPMTRDAGNMLIALFFGIYIVAPTLYAMSGAAFEKVLANPVMHGVYSFSDWSLGSDSVPLQEKWLFRIGSLMPQAVFVPNLVVVVVVTCTMSLAKGLRAIQV